MTLTADERKSLLWIADTIHNAAQFGVHHQNKMYTSTFAPAYKVLVERVLREAAHDGSETTEDVANELAYFERHADRFADAHRDIAAMATSFEVDKDLANILDHAAMPDGDV